MDEHSLAYSKYRIGTKEFDRRVVRQLDQLGRGRKDYMYAQVKMPNEAPDLTGAMWYHDLCGRIIVVCSEHQGNTSTKYFIETQIIQGNPVDFLILKDHLKILDI